MRKFIILTVILVVLLLSSVSISSAESVWDYLTKGYADILYCKLTGCTMEGNITFIGNAGLVNATYYEVNLTDFIGEHWLNETRETGATFRLDNDGIGDVTIDLLSNSEAFACLNLTEGGANKQGFQICNDGDGINEFVIRDRDTLNKYITINRNTGEINFYNDTVFHETVVTNFINVSETLTAQRINTSYISSIIDLSVMDIRGNPWYLSGAGFQVDGNVTANNFFGIYDWIIKDDISRDWLAFNGTELSYNKETHQSQFYNKSEVDVLVSSTSFDFFFTDQSSDLTGMFNFTEIDTGAPESFLQSAVITTGITSIFNFTTVIGQPEFNELRNGVYDVHAHFLVTSGGKKPVTIIPRLYNMSSNGDNKNLLITFETSETLTTSPIQYNLHGVLNETVMLADDARIMLELVAVVGVGGGDPTVQIDMEGTTDSHFTLQTSTQAFEKIFLRKDGLNFPTANINWGGFNIYNLGSLNATNSITSGNLKGSTCDVYAYAENGTLFCNTTVSSSGDNLGNHTATKDLDMNNFDINNVTIFSNVNSIPTFQPQFGVIKISDTNDGASGRAQLWFLDEGTEQSVITANHKYDHLFFGVSLAVDYSYIIGNYLHGSLDFDHGAQTNPTLFLQSVTNPGTDNTQWMSFAHNTTDGVIETGKGIVYFNNTNVSANYFIGDGSLLTGISGGFTNGSDITVGTLNVTNSITSENLKGSTCDVYAYATNGTLFCNTTISSSFEISNASILNLTSVYNDTQLINDNNDTLVTYIDEITNTTTSGETTFRFVQSGGRTVFEMKVT